MRVSVRRTKVYGSQGEHSAAHGLIVGGLLGMAQGDHLMVQRHDGRMWRSTHPIVLLSKSSQSAEVWCATEPASPLDLIERARQGRALVEVYRVKYLDPPEPSAATPSRRTPRSSASSRGR